MKLNLKMVLTLIILALLSLAVFAKDDGRAEIYWYQSRHPGQSLLVVTYHKRVYKFLVEDAAINDSKFVEGIVNRVTYLDSIEQADNLDQEEHEN